MVETGSFGSRWKGGSAAAGKEPGAAIAGPRRLPFCRLLKKAEVAALSDEGV